MQIDPDDLVTDVPPSGTGCLECEQTGSWWFHLRRCARCGHVGCRDTGHTLMQSFEPGEDWFWDFSSEQAFTGPELAAPHEHPAAQSVPGPAERVPADWQEVLASRKD
jgi:hypothetical protein